MSELFEDNEAIEKINAKISELAATVKDLADEVTKGKKKEDYPYPDEDQKKKEKEKEEAFEAKIKTLEDSVKIFETENTGLKTKLTEFEDRDKSDKVDELVNAQFEKELIKEEDKTATAESFKSFSVDQLDIMIKNTAKFHTKPAKPKSFKSGEPGTNLSDENKVKLDELQERREDFMNSGVGTADIDAEIKTLTGAA